MAVIVTAVVIEQPQTAEKPAHAMLTAIAKPPFIQPNHLFIAINKSVLIPASAHGTNPASAVMAGMQVVVVNCDDKGNIDLDHLKRLAEENREKLAAFMITYPSTHGVFEEQVIEMIEVIHESQGEPVAYIISDLFPMVIAALIMLRFLRRIFLPRITFLT